MKDVFYLLNIINISLLNKQKMALYKPKNVKLCLKFLKVIYEEGFILSYSYNIKFNVLNVFLNYYKNQYVLGNIKSFNKSTFPVYIKYRDLIAIQNFGISILILSTVKGFMPHYLALKNRLGGKAICLLQ